MHKSQEDVVGFSNEENIIEKGKLGPGQIIAIDLKKGKLFKDKEIKDLLAKDYKRYNKQIIDLEKKISNENEKEIKDLGEFNFNQSTLQAFYFIEDIVDAEEGRDFVVAKIGDQMSWWDRGPEWV